MRCPECDIEHLRKNATYCSDRCGKKHRQARYLSTPAGARKLKTARRGRYEKQTDRHLLARAKHRAKELGVPFDLDLTDTEVPAVCPVLGIAIVVQFGNGHGRKINSPSVDRIKPALGYVKGNGRVISRRANLLKNNATVQELELVLADLRNLTQ